MKCEHGKKRLGDCHTCSRERNRQAVQRYRYGRRGDPRGEACGICKARKKHMVVDHNHETGAVRGFLCKQCNSGLGLFCDNPALVKRALDWLCEEGE